MRRETQPGNVFERENAALEQQQRGPQREGGLHEQPRSGQASHTVFKRPVGGRARAEKCDRHQRDRKDDHPDCQFHRKALKSRPATIDKRVLRKNQTGLKWQGREDDGGRAAVRPQPD
jgi:hypothetical protein